MLPSRRVLGAILLAASLLGPSLAAALAQPATGGCRLESLANPPRQVLRCGGGLTVTSERGAAQTPTDRDGDGRPDAIGLRGGAALVDMPAGGRRFEVVTPQAIAAVRGTRWAIDVSGGTTAVFVVSGRVEVRRRSDGASVTLSPGQGIDIDASRGPLEVRRWSAARAAALLVRLGG